MVKAQLQGRFQQPVSALGVRGLGCWPKGLGVGACDLGWPCWALLQFVVQCLFCPHGCVFKAKPSSVQVRKASCIRMPNPDKCFEARLLGNHVAHVAFSEDSATWDPTAPEGYTSNPAPSTQNMPQSRLM